MTRFFTFIVFPLLFTLGMWLSTGTLAPYAYTLDEPKVLGECEYLANSDHPLFEAPFSFLSGIPASNLATNYMLRRILFPFLAYPFVKRFGLELGGFLAAALITLLCFYIFILHIEKKTGSGSAFVAAALLATYPGTMYWVGLPYCYVAIVPISLLCYVGLNVLNESDSFKRNCFVFGCLGILFLGYDLAPFFGLPALWLVRRKHKVWKLAILGFVMSLPTLLMLHYLSLKGVAVTNENTGTYFVILKAYLNPSELRRWIGLVARFPIYLTEAYFFSNFLFLPMGMLTIFVLLRGKKKLGGFTSVEKSILGAGFLLYAFNNLAPPYTGWQMRGGWILRLYQPLFVVYIVFLARSWRDLSGYLNRRILYTSVIFLVVVGNGMGVFGPYLGIQWNLVLYEKFYGHGTPGVSFQNLQKFGRRPIGVCR